jgi:hypothetical protein
MVSYEFQPPLSEIVKHNGLSIRIAKRALSILARAIWQVLLALRG